MWTKRDIADRLTLHEEYIFRGPAEELNRRIAKLKIRSVKKIDINMYRIEPMMSIGTLTVSGVPGLIRGIYVYASVTSVSEEKQLVTFSTNIRPEHYFIGITFPIATLLISILKSWWTFPFMMALWFIFHWWSWAVSRHQENLVMEKAVSGLRLKKVRK